MRGELRLALPGKDDPTAGAGRADDPYALESAPKNIDGGSTPAAETSPETLSWAKFNWKDVLAATKDTESAIL